MQKRNLLYTAVMRGKRLMVGQKTAAAIAVRNASGLRRWPKLDEWLAGGRTRPEREAGSGARSRKEPAAAGRGRASRRHGQSVRPPRPTTGVFRARVAVLTMC